MASRILLQIIVIFPCFDNLAVNVNKEIMLEIPSLNDLSDRFLSHVPTIYSRVIIDEFDVSDPSNFMMIMRSGIAINL